jgi:hypothetical protein
VAALALGAVVFAAQLAETGDDVAEPVVTGEAAERLIPARGSEILAQERVGIDLAVGFDAVLRLNGMAIPEDQLIRRNGVNEILYGPAEDDAAVEFMAGENCLEADVWPLEDGPAAARTITWCFNVT